VSFVYPVSVQTSSTSTQELTGGALTFQVSRMAAPPKLEASMK
jgi:hypothetical protein